MKKIISMLLAVCTLASFVTVASAADEPTVNVVVNKVDFTDPAYSAYAEDYDWSPYNEEYGTVYETYSMKVFATGMEFKTESVKVGKVTNAAGNSVVAYQASFSVESNGAEYNSDWMAGTIYEFGGDATDNANDTQVAAALAGTTALLPAPGEVETFGKDQELLLVEFLVTVDTNKPMTFNFDNAKVSYGIFDSTKAAPTGTGEYKLGETMVTETPVITLPVADTPVDPEPVKPIDISEKIDLEATVEGEKVLGAAWNVTLNEYDSTKTYVANFSAENGDTRIPREIGNLPAETEGSVSFAVLLKLNKARNVTLSIVEQ